MKLLHFFIPVVIIGFCYCNNENGNSSTQSKNSNPVQPNQGVTTKARDTVIYYPTGKDTIIKKIIIAPDPVPQMPDSIKKKIRDSVVSIPLKKDSIISKMIVNSDPVPPLPDSLKK